jgi:hypothetical protein
MTSNKVSNRTYELSYFEPINLVPTLISRNKKFDLVRGQTERRLSPKMQKLMGCMTEQNEYLFTKPPKLIDGSFEKISDLPGFKLIEEYIKFPKKESIWLEILSFGLYESKGFASFSFFSILIFIHSLILPVFDSIIMHTFGKITPRFIA